MRFVVIAFFGLSVLCANAQDASQMAAQQSMQAAQQANQQAMQAAQDANQQAMQAAQQANDQAMRAAQQASMNNCCGPYYAASPRFSLKTGTYRAGKTVRLKDSTRGAVMYYTTDGWTPTTRSKRYVGPIVLTSTTTLQAIAVAPGYIRSRVAAAVYTIPGAPVALPPTTIAALNPGTPLPFIFTSDVTSKGLEIGDRLPVALAEDLVVGGVLVAPKLTPAHVTVMQVDGPGAGGAPGTITFAIHFITLANGETIPLSGTETSDGHSRATASQSLGLIPWVGLAGLFIHGKPAEIPKGAIFTGYIESGNADLQANMDLQDAQQP